LINMQSRILPCFLIAFVFLLMITRSVSAQSGIVQITKVTAPTSVAAGQQLTVTVTISFNLPNAQSVIVALMPFMPSLQMGYPYQVSEISGSPYSCAVSISSVCNVQLPIGTNQGTFTASFTLDAPNLVGAWQPIAIVYWGSTLEDYRAVPITITQPVPETSSPLLLLFATLIATVSIIKSVKPTRLRS
jgi:hypothetical protein